MLKHLAPGQLEHSDFQTLDLWISITEIQAKKHGTNKKAIQSYRP